MVSGYVSTQQSSDAPAVHNTTWSPEIELFVHSVGPVDDSGSGGDSAIPYAQAVDTTAPSAPPMDTFQHHHHTSSSGGFMAGIFGTSTSDAFSSSSAFDNSSAFTSSSTAFDSSSSASAPTTTTSSSDW